MSTVLAEAWRIVFLTASAPAIGAVLLLAIARVTGARWGAVRLPAIAVRLVIPAAALLGLAQVAVPLPPHLATWMHPVPVGVRAVIAAGLLAFAGARLASGASETFAAIVLALYAALVTPIATDWLLGGVPGHSVSAAGMMLFVEQVAAACAVALVTGRGDPRERADLSKLMVAAALGLGYLAYMDFLVLWFGNLPARVGFYVARGGLPGVLPAWVALAAGLVLPVALLMLRRGVAGQRQAGAAVLVGLLAFNAWWVGGGIVAWLLAAAPCLAIVAVARFRRGMAHG